MEKAETNIEVVPSKESEKENPDQLKKSAETFVPSFQEEQDVCPTCLEGLAKPTFVTPLIYMFVLREKSFDFFAFAVECDAENPKILTHYVHLACIPEWIERSDACPICEQD
ncbi:protein binding protein [Dorcoceras hygrometricum]|uniref:RING-type E3 ubiquitin transferase n=1 Tax=Dorcoceras hygrometricum TaxID=472368 RepID=A0A2Z7BAM0_9LAMI|nr:protein binding protein [Dorcoceras hygrometricum]